jgi:hypothetical protein
MVTVAQSGEFFGDSFFCVSGFWAWWKSRNKKADVMQVEIVDERKSPPKRKNKEK